MGEKMQYSIGQYIDYSDCRRCRWAVFDTQNKAWYFPKYYGKNAAIALAIKMNKEQLK